MRSGSQPSCRFIHPQAKLERATAWCNLPLRPSSGAWLKPPDYAIITSLFAHHQPSSCPPPPPPPPFSTPGPRAGHRQEHQSGPTSWWWAGVRLPVPPAHTTPGCLAAALRSPPPCYGGSPAANPSAHGAMATRAGLRMGDH